MKSIYEEALELLNEVLLVNKKTTFTLSLPISFEIDIDNFLYQALEQAQKQEKLLELYRELNSIKDKMIRLVFFDNDYYDTLEIATDLEKQIKEIEK